MRSIAFAALLCAAATANALAQSTLDAGCKAAERRGRR